MPDRDELIDIFDDTLFLCEESEALSRAIQNSIDGQKVYWAEDEVDYVNRADGPEAELKLTDATTVAAAGRYPGMKVCALNFASSVNPGGGVLKGSRAQEECICRATTLYPALTEDDRALYVYTRHRELIELGAFDRANTDDMIYTPGVVAIKEDTGCYKPLPEDGRFSFDVISSAAPDLRHGGSGAIYPDENELRSLFEKRIDRIFRIAALSGSEVLILGAFGCGAFGNSPKLVADVFKNAASRFIHDFKVIDFAIPYSAKHVPSNYEVFKSVLGL